MEQIDKENKFEATIDRFEGHVAIVLPRDDESNKIIIPVCLLPQYCHEGDILLISIISDSVETNRVMEKVGAMIEALKNKNDEC